MLNRVFDEMQFFYNPVSLVDIANGSVMPPLSMVYDFTSLIKHIGTEGYGFIIQDEEIQESSKPLKYALKLSTLGNNLMYYSAIASKDIADGLGVQITSQSRSRR